MKKLILSFLFIAFATTAINAQTNFQRVYSNMSMFISVQQTTDGGYIAAGYDTAHACFLKLDANGNTMWTKTFRGNDHRQFFSVYQNTDGGYIAAGRIYPLNPPNNIHKIYLVRTNASGDSLWTRCYGGTQGDDAYSVKQTPDGGFAIAGQTSSFGYGAYIIKTDASGNILWTKTYASGYSGSCNEIQNTSDGGFIMIGKGYSTSPCSGDGIFIIKTNSSGDTLWTRGYCDWYLSYLSFGSSIIQTSDGGYIALGNMYITNATEAIMIKLNSSGDTMWTKKLFFSDINSSYYDGFFTSIKQTTDGGYIIGGGSTYGAYLNSDLHAVLVKTDMNGDTIWTKKYVAEIQNLGSDLYISDLKLANDGGYICAGHSVYGAYLLKTDSLGNATCDAGYANFDYVNYPIKKYQGATLGSGGNASGIYTVAGTLDTAYYNPCLPIPGICMVTVDSAIQKNKVIWEKNFDTTYVSSYNIYKETTQSGVYAIIGNVPNNVLSTFIDNASNPAQQAAKYKISLVDALGIEGIIKSNPHKTIHLSVNLGIPPQINLIWNYYEGFTVSTYRIWRGNTSGMDLIDSVAGSMNSYTDLNPPPRDSLYFIEALKPNGNCNPTAKSYSSTISNFINTKHPLGIAEQYMNAGFSLYPNPVNDNLQIQSNLQIKSVEILDVTGRLLYSTIAKIIDCRNFAKGIYFIRVTTEKGVAVKKFVKE